MKQTIKKEPTKPGYINEGLKLLKDYFLKSNQRLKAFLLLLLITVCLCASIALMVLFSWWASSFWAALTVMSLPLFIASMQLFGIILIAGTLTSAVQNYSMQQLTINWRNWLTNDFLNRYVSRNKNNYLELSRHPQQMDNPEQRIQSDIRTVVDETISLGTSLFTSTVTLALFVGSLWVLSGTITLTILGTSLTVPGLLVWCALLFAGISGAITHRIGRSLTTKAHHQESIEANFRQNLSKLNHEAESISQDHGEDYYKQSLSTKFKAIMENSKQLIQTKTKLTAFKSFYIPFSQMFPYIAAAPLYFASQISLAQLMQVGFSFQMVQTSLDWFLNSYEIIAKYKASLMRLVALKKTLHDDGLQTSPRDILIQKGRANELSTEHLTVTSPSSTNAIFQKLNLTFKPHEHVLIKGISGIGKSTLLKTLAGAWTYGHGKISIPSTHTVCFLPQKPSIPEDTLKAVLAYPKSVETYTHNDYVAVLRLVRTMDSLINELDSKSTWSQRLSPGQQQRISFARALLQKPDWLLLDEATASLDPDSEDYLYHLIKQQLPNTTIISVAHRESVAKFHDKAITLGRPAQPVPQQKPIDQKAKLMNTTAANDQNTPVVIIEPARKCP